MNLSGRPWQKKYPHTSMPLVEKDPDTPFQVEVSEVPNPRRGSEGTHWVTDTMACNAQGICEPIWEEERGPAVWENEVVLFESLLVATDIALGMLQGCLPTLYRQTAEGLVDYRVDVHFPRYPPMAIVVDRGDVEALDATVRDIEELLHWYMAHPPNLNRPVDIGDIRYEYDAYGHAIPAVPRGDPRDELESTHVLGVFLNSCIEEQTRQQLTPPTHLVGRGLELIHNWHDFEVMGQVEGAGWWGPPETRPVSYLVRDVCWLMAAYMRPDLPWSTAITHTWRTHKEAEEAAEALQRAFDIWWQEVKDVLAIRDVPEMEELL